eukprot:scaffold306126_cov22-Tisochrysis_lutea.AAC.1
MKPPLFVELVLLVQMRNLQVDWGCQGYKCPLQSTCPLFRCAAASVIGSGLSNEGPLNTIEGNLEMRDENISLVSGACAPCLSALLGGQSCMSLQRPRLSALNCTHAPSMRIKDEP